jgi:hypothetical protein
VRNFRRSNRLDWHSPIRNLQAKAWAEHPERDRLEQLWRERDDKGEHVWEQVLA